ncbi:MAG: polysaccharide biosynthesis tyrosine autokinase [Verrucomicrobiota bacterium]
MKDLIPVSSSDSGLQLLEPMANGHAPVAAPKFRLQKLLFFLRKFWWIPLLTLALGVSTAVIVFFNTPATFVSYGSMWETEKLRLPDGAAFTYDRDNYVGTLTELLRSRMIWNRTTNYMIAFHKDLLSWDKDGYLIPVDLQVFASPKSSVYTIEARSANPAFTPAYLNALMEQYKEYRLNVRGQVSVHTENSISEQVQMYERDMKAAQAALAEYERSNNFAVLQQESTIDGAYLVKLKTELSDYQLQTNLLAARELEMDSGQAGSTNSSDTIFDSLRGGGPESSSATGRLDAEKQIEMLKLDRERLAKYLRPAHPKMVKLDQDIAHAQKLDEVYREQNHQQIVASRQALQIKIDNVERFIQEWEAKVGEANERLAKADGLKQEVISKQRMFDRLSSLNDNVQVSQHIDQDTLDILDEASPAKRSYTEAKSMLMQSIVGGLGIGVGIVFLLALRDDRFRSLVEVTEKFGDNVVGQVPELPHSSPAEPPALLELNDDRHMYAESYRNLRSALLYLAVDGMRPKTLLVTSAVPDEGKSTVAVNLARALALGGSRVLLIDGDMRKGHLHELLKLRSKPGFSELLRQGDGAENCIQATDLPDFSFVSRGSIARNPGDLFLSPAFEPILKRFRDCFDFVLVDSSPVFAADDTVTLAPKMDGTLFVVRSQFSHGRAVQGALELLFQRQATVLGLILNRTDPSAGSYHLYKYAEYHSGAGDGEEINAEKLKS